MKGSDGEREFLERTRQLLERSAEDVPEPIAERLRQSRRRALDAGPKPRLSVPALWGPVGGFALASAVLLSAILYFAGPLGPERSAVGPATVADYQPEDMEILVSGESPEFYENLYFYQWLSEQDIDAS